MSQNYSRKRIIEILKSYKISLEENNINHNNQNEKIRKPHTKSLYKKVRPMKARDNLKTKTLREDKSNEVF